MRSPLVLLIVLAACDRPADPSPAGSLTTRFDGIATGAFAAPASARWCPSDSLLEILAISGDTGVGLSLLVQDTVRPGQYPALSGGINVDWRPLALGGLRWASDTALQGYEATDGRIDVRESAPGTVSGSIDLRLRLNDGTDTLRLTGGFSDVAIEPATGSCGRVSKVRVR